MGLCSSASAEQVAQESMLSKNAAAIMGNGKEPIAVKLLMLGAGGSGKTTFRKQLRSIHVGFSATQRKESVPVILDNVVQGAQAIINFIVSSKPDFTDPATEVGKSAQFILAMNNPLVEFDEITVNHLRLVWAQPEVQEAITSRNKFQLEDCVLSFFPELVKSWPEWGGPKWTPSVDDCVRARVRSTGVAEEHFVVDGITFKLFDAGGQRSERRKWIHYFDKVHSVLYMASLTSYCEQLFEDSHQNSLVESLDLFDNISNSKWFRLTPIMLFLNKHDLFLERFVDMRIPLNASGLFPSAPESVNPDEAIAWFSKQFKDRKKDVVDAEGEEIRSKDSLLYIHITTAVSQDSVQKVFYTSKAIILKNALNDSGFALL